MLLYAAYFFIGAGVGAAHFNRGVLSADGRLAKSGWGWVIATLVPYCLLWVLIYIKREILGNPGAAALVRGKLRPLLRRLQRGHLVGDPGIFPQVQTIGLEHLDPMQNEAYGMFLVHYPIVLWLQYWLFDFDVPAIVKAAVAFVLTVALSGPRRPRCGKFRAQRMCCEHFTNHAIPALVTFALKHTCAC